MSRISNTTELNTAINSRASTVSESMPTFNRPATSTDNISIQRGQSHFTSTAWSPSIALVRNESEDEKLDPEHIVPADKEESSPTPDATYMQLMKWTTPTAEPGESRQNPGTNLEGKPKPKPHQKAETEPRPATGLSYDDLEARGKGSMINGPCGENTNFFSQTKVGYTKLLVTDKAIMINGPVDPEIALALVEKFLGRE